MKKDLSVGIDTSNYKTSVAVVNENGDILFNHQQFLEVKEGERGLRQSEALFRHVQNLPPVLERMLSDDNIREHIGAVAVSTRPRPIEGSYMPVFTAGSGYAKTIAAALNVPLYEVSHQEGHVEAVRYYSSLKDYDEPLVCFHFSGGTTEALLVEKGNFQIVGGTKDLAYGQVLDRIGVAMGMSFPCGEEMDKIAVSVQSVPKLFTPIKVKDGFVNLSGIETQGQRMLTLHPDDQLLASLFDTLSASIAEITMQISKKFGVKNFIYAGGVSCSRYIRKALHDRLPQDYNIVFGRSELSSDNAIGVALLGGKHLWH